MRAAIMDAAPLDRVHDTRRPFNLPLDHLIYRSTARPDLRLTSFIQLGFAQPIVSRIVTYLGAGLALNGFLPDRTANQVAIGLAMARNSAYFVSTKRQPGSCFDAAETALGLSYLAQVKSWLTMQPDLQYVIHPSAYPNLRNATVAQPRFVMAN